MYELKFHQFTIYKNQDQLNSKCDFKELSKYNNSIDEHGCEYKIYTYIFVVTY